MASEVLEFCPHNVSHHAMEAGPGKGDWPIFEQGTLAFAREKESLSAIFAPRNLRCSPFHRGARVWSGRHGQAAVGKKDSTFALLARLCTTAWQPKLSRVLLYGSLAQARWPPAGSKINRNQTSVRAGRGLERAAPAAYCDSPVGAGILQCSGLVPRLRFFSLAETSRVATAIRRASPVVAGGAAWARSRILWRWRSEARTERSYCRKARSRLGLSDTPRSPDFPFPRSLRSRTSAFSTSARIAWATPGSSPPAGNRLIISRWVLILRRPCSPRL
jgi:hypothetical protein